MVFHSLLKSYLGNKQKSIKQETSTCVRHNHAESTIKSYNVLLLCSSSTRGGKEVKEESFFKYHCLQIQPLQMMVRRCIHLY